MKLIPTCFLAGKLCSIGVVPIALVALLSSTDSKIGSNSSISPARSHEHSVCAIPIVLASKRERRGVHHPPCGREKPLTFGGHGPHFSALVFLREPSPKFGPNLWALTGGTRLIFQVWLGACLREGPPKKCQGAKVQHRTERRDTVVNIERHDLCPPHRELKWN